MRRAQNIEGVVENAADEMGKTSQGNKSVGEMVPAGLDPANLDSFLQTSPTITDSGTEDDLPSLEWLRHHFQTKSAVIRYLHHKGYSVKVIAKHLDLRYQHVRNVLTVELKRGPNESWRLSDD